MTEALVDIIIPDPRLMGALNNDVKATSQFTFLFTNASDVFEVCFNTHRNQIS